MSGNEDVIMSMTDGNNDIAMSNQVTTIDASVVRSRISISASLAKENEIDDQPVFPKLSAMQAGGGRVEYRRVRCPPHRYTPLRENWEQILMPLVEYLKLQVSGYFVLLLSFLEIHTFENQMMKGATNVSPWSCSWSLNRQTHQEASSDV